MASPQLSDKEYFEILVEKIETSDDQGKEEFEKFCHQHSKLVSDIVKFQDKRTEVNEEFVFMGKSLVRREDATLLHYAVMNNCVKTAKLLIQEGADPAAEMKDKSNALHYAVSEEMLKEIFASTKENIEWEKVVKKVNIYDWTPLFYAIKLKKVSMVKCLLNHGADAKEKIEEYGGSAFLFAAKYSSAEVFKCMKEHHQMTSVDLKKFVNEAKTERSSGNKHEFDGVGSKTLYFACSQKPKKRERSIQLVKILLKFGADPTECDENGQNGLHYAARCSDESVLRRILASDKMRGFKDKDSLINKTDNDGYSPLWYAFDQGQPKLVQILMQNGAKIKKESETKNQALNFVQKRKELCNGILVTLIENDSYAGEILESIAVCLDETCFHMNLNLQHQDIEQRLGTRLVQQLNSQEMVDRELNVFQLAVVLNQPAKLKILLKAYESILIKLEFINPSGRIDNEFCNKFPYHLAFYWGCSPDLIDQLNKRGCTKKKAEGLDRSNETTQPAASNEYRDIYNSKKNSPLHCLSEKTQLAALKRYRDIMGESKIEEMLTKTNSNDKTPLEIAIECERLDILELFVKHWKVDSSPSTLMYAIEKQKKEYCEILVKHGENIFQMLNIDAPRKKPGEKPAEKKPFIQLIKFMPDMALEALNRCHEKDEKKAQELVSNYKSKEHPLKVMVKHKRNIELLQHDVVDEVIKSKWLQYGLLFYVSNLLTYIFYLGFLSALSQILPNPRESVVCRTPNATMITTNSQLKVLPSFVIAFGIIRLINEVIQFILSLVTIIKERKTIIKECKHSCSKKVLPSYFFPIFNKLDSYLEMLIFISAIVISAIVLSSTSGCLTSMTYNFTVFIVALSWINLILFLSKLPYTGLYALIFISMVKTFLKLAFFALLLVIGSTLVLVMLFSNSQAPRSPFTLDFGTAMVKVITMVTGELGFEDIFALSYDVEDPLTTDSDIVGISRTPLLSSGVAYFMWIAFLVFMPILLSNMLTGLAVGDVEKIIKDAIFTKIKDQVDFMMNIEQFVPFKKVKRIEWVESCNNKFFKPVLWKPDDEKSEKSEDTTLKREDQGGDIELQTVTVANNNN